MRVMKGEKTVAELTGVYSREPGVWRGAVVIVNATRPSSDRAAHEDGAAGARLLPTRISVP